MTPSVDRNNYAQFTILQLLIVIKPEDAWKTISLEAWTSPLGIKLNRIDEVYDEIMYLFCARMTHLLYKNIAQVTCTCGSDATSHAIVWSDAKQMMSGQRKYWKKTDY